MQVEPTATGPETKTPRPHETRYRPFRSWALQQDLFTLLGAEPAWQADANELGLDPTAVDHDGTLRGQAYLREALEPEPQFSLRTKTSVVLWISVFFTDSLNQWGPTGLKMDTRWFWPMIAFVCVAIGFAALIFPRLRGKWFRLLEQIVLSAAVALTAFQVAVTGGTESPFSVWLLFTTIYAAYFLPRRQIAWNTASMVFVALLPIAYEQGGSSTNAILYTVLLCAIVCAMSVTIFYRRSISRATERGVKFLALADPLTSVANLRAIDQFASSLAASKIDTFAVVMVDMNGLRGANAVFGYDVGDGMVVRLSRLLLQASNSRAQVARIGGDEFAVLLPNANDASIDNWRFSFDAAVAAHNESIRGRLPQISVSVGISVYPDDGANADELIDAADKRMYTEKTPAVPPPHVIGDQLPISARRLISAPSLSYPSDRPSGPRENRLHAGGMWLMVGMFVLIWPTLPGASVPNLTGTLLLGMFCVLISAIAFAGCIQQFEKTSRRTSDVATLLLAAPGMWLTGGWQSPFQLAGIMVVAYYSQFFRGMDFAWRCALVLGLYTVAFWTSGEVSLAGQSLFATIITAELAIAAILRLNAGATDSSRALIRDSATHDSLTGIRNLYAFRADLAEVIEREHNDGATDPCRPALILADIDNFRKVNTLAGHSGGDAILREVVRRLGTASGDSGVIYRIGGDEFAILCSVERSSDAARLAERCRRALNFRPPEYLNISTQVVTSVGFSVLQDGMSSAAFVSAVESALEQRKSATGDRVAADNSVLL